MVVLSSYGITPLCLPNKSSGNRLSKRTIEPNYEPGHGNEPGFSTTQKKTLLTYQKRKKKMARQMNT